MLKNLIYELDKKQYMLTDNTKKKNMKRPKSYDIIKADPNISIKGGWWCRKKDCNTICAKKYQKIPTVLDLGQMRPCTS